jgi:hypothetical protein
MPICVTVQNPRGLRQILSYKILKSSQAERNLVGPASAGAGLQPRMRRSEGCRRLSTDHSSERCANMLNRKGLLSSTAVPMPCWSVALETARRGGFPLKSAPPRIRRGYAVLWGRPSACGGLSARQSAEFRSPTKTR